MKILRSAFPLLTICIFPLFPVVWQKQNDVEIVKQINDAYNLLEESSRQGSINSIAEYIHKDFIYTGPDGKKLEREKFLSSQNLFLIWNGGHPSKNNDNLQIKNVKDVAIYSYSLHLKAGEPSKLIYSVTDVWIFDHSSWHLLTRHISPANVEVKK